MTWPVTDTIAAIASASAGAVRGIIRVSGPASWPAVESCLVPGQDSWRKNHQPSVVNRDWSMLQTVVPCRLYGWPERRGYTGQPTIEIHTFGSPPLLDLMLRQLCQQGVRLAQPGEFTLRAFLAGRLDLTQAEAVLAVIDAASQRELSIALKQLAGGMATPLAALRDSLLNLLADLEAELDFVEEDIEFVPQLQLQQRLQSAHLEVQQLVQRVAQRGAHQVRPTVVLYGEPNAGKSSLFNALAGEQKAIVSALPGTTQDYLQADVLCGNLPIRLLDTAGVENLAQADALPASQAQQQSRERQQESQLRVLCIDASQPPSRWLLSELAREDVARFIVLTKGDLPVDVAWANQGLVTSSLAVSVRTGAGLRELHQQIAAACATVEQPEELLDSTAARCFDSLQQALTHLSASNTALQLGLSREFLAGDVRLALDELGRVAGTVVTEDLLDRIFSRFCIGK